jgi:hypothetical protein
MKLSSLFTKLTVIASSTCMMLIGIPTLATAAPFTEKDYFLFTASTRNREKGEKRFKEVIQVSYGNRDLPKGVYGFRGPAPIQRISLRSSKGSITLRGTSNKNIISIELNRDPRTRREIVTMVVDNARCQVGTARAEPCQAEIQVTISKNQISDRIIASGSNGAEYDSGAQDASSTLYAQLASPAK